MIGDWQAEANDKIADVHLIGCTCNRCKQYGVERSVNALLGAISEIADYSLDEEALIHVLNEERWIVDAHRNIEILIGHIRRQKMKAA